MWEIRVQSEDSRVLGPHFFLGLRRFFQSAGVDVGRVQSGCGCGIPFWGRIFFLSHGHVTTAPGILDRRFFGGFGVFFAQSGGPLVWLQGKATEMWAAGFGKHVFIGHPQKRKLVFQNPLVNCQLL